MSKKSIKKQEEETKKSKEKPSQAEYEKKIIQLVEKGLTSEKIGEELRRQGIHPKEYRGRVSQILGKKYSNPDLINLEKKLAKIEEHTKKNKQDKKAIRERSRIFSSIRKIKKYFKIE